MRACLRRNQPGPYQLQAAIGAVHADAPAAADTDWRQILALYDQLAAITPTPVVALNRCVAVAEVHGPGVALGLLDRLDLDDYHLFHATRADLLRRIGRPADAAAAYDAAITRAANGAERSFLTRQRDALGTSPPRPLRRWPAAVEAPAQPAGGPATVPDAGAYGILTVVLIILVASSALSWVFHASTLMTGERTRAETVARQRRPRSRARHPLPGLLLT